MRVQDNPVRDTCIKSEPLHCLDGDEAPSAERRVGARDELLAEMTNRPAQHTERERESGRQARRQGAACATPRQCGSAPRAAARSASRFTLSRRSFRILQLNRRIRTRATVTLRNAAGLSSTASKQITLKAPE
jgi:hypothetical protein